MTTKKNKKPVKAQKKGGKKPVENTPPRPTTKSNKLFKYLDAGSVDEPLKLLQYVEWIAVPKQERSIKRLEDFAKFVGLDRWTLSQWKKKEGFWDEVAIHRDNFFRKYSTAVAFGLMNRAKKTGSSKEVKLFFQLFEKFSEKIKVEDETPYVPDEIKKNIAKATGAWKDMLYKKISEKK